MRYSIIFLLSFVCQMLQGQRFLFENYTSDKGLSQHICTSIAQDADGFMWFGTVDGLNRYDGKKFKIFSQHNAAGKKLPANYISALYFDSSHNLLWIATARGLYLYIPSADSISAVSAYFPFAASLDKLFIKQIVSYQQNEFWIITGNNGLLRMNTEKGTLQSYFNSDEDKTNVTDIEMHSGKLIVSLLYTLFTLEPAGDSYKPVPMHEDYLFPQIRTLASFDNRLWIGTISAGCYYIKNPIQEKKNIVASDIVFGGIEYFATDNHNNLWIGTRGSGIHVYNASTGVTSKAIHNQFDPTTPVSNFCLNIFNDRQGSVWCGLSGGIAKYDPLRYQFTNVNGATSLNGSLLDNAIYKLYTCKDGTKYVGTQNRGLMQWTKEDNSFKHFPKSAIVNIANNVISDITEDNEGMLWSATCGGLMQLNRKNGKITYHPEKQKREKLNRMHTLVKLKKADSLLISSDDGLRFFSLRNKSWVSGEANSSHESVEAKLSSLGRANYFYEDGENNLWICMSRGGGLVRYNYLKNEIEKIESVSKLTYGIYYLYPDGDTLLLATGNGLIVYDRKNKRIIKQVHVKSKNGISDVCHAVQKDNAGFIWVSSNFGLYKISREYNIIQHFNTGNGLSFQEFNISVSMKDADGTLYFGGMEGITYFNPSQLRQNTFSPRPIITDIFVNDKSLTLDKSPSLINELSFDHNQNFITFYFAVNNFSNEHNNLFSYRLKGLNNNWSTATNTNMASFTSIPPGNYIFELRSANSDGKWSDDIQTVAITLRTPWWQTWWFQISTLLLLAAIVTFFIRRRIQTIRRDAVLKQQMAELEIKGLHTQMNPHFIFNSLNSIKEMIWKEDKLNASRYLSKFAQLIRTSLDHSRQTFITIRQCVDHLRQYLEMEKLRFEDFSYTIEVADDLNADETRIAPMLVQPLVENAIWHGLRSKASDRRLLIRFFKKGQQVICEIDDNGVGIQHTMKNKDDSLTIHHSLGIANIKERLQVLNEKYQMNCSLRINDKGELPFIQDSGTLAVLHLSV